MSEPAVVPRSVLSSPSEDPPVRPWATSLRVRGSSPSAVVRREILLVLGLSLGMSAIYSVLSLIAKLTEDKPLNQQTTSLNTSPTPERPLLSLVYILLGIVVDIMPALLALYLLNRSASSATSTVLGLNLRRPRFDVLSSVVLASVIGIPGLALYLTARTLGLNTTVAAANLTEWWAGPALVLLAFGNGLLEEVVMIGYLLTRLRQGGWGIAAAVTFSAVLRGTYHLYQGFGAFVGNAIMGVVFALFFLRTRRLWPLILAHTILDVVAFLGYTLLKDHVSWL